MADERDIADDSPADGGGRKRVIIIAAGMLLLLLGIGMFPELIHARPDPSLSMTAFNASSSERTLKTMLILAGIGMPPSVSS